MKQRKKLNALKAKTDRLFDDMNREKSKIMSFMNLDYLSLREEDKLIFGNSGQSYIKLISAVE